MNLSNELLLVISTLFIYLTFLLWYRLFKKEGLFCWTVFATIAANIEVLILVNAFGIEQTLGNILFASTFLVTDVLSETEGKKTAQKAVNIGIVTSLTFIVLTQLWLCYTPSENDWAFPSIQTLFSNTPRLMLVSLIVYIIVQRFDVWLYHTLWAFTTKLCGDSSRYLWVRNNGSTMVSQLLNAVLYTFGAFWGMYSMKTLVSIALSSYIIFWITALIDTPVAYAARKIHNNQQSSDIQ